MKANISFFNNKNFGFKAISNYIDTLISFRVIILPWELQSRDSSCSYFSKFSLWYYKLCSGVQLIKQNSESSNYSVSLSFLVLLIANISLNCAYFIFIFFPVQCVHLSFICKCSSQMRTVCWHITFSLKLLIFSFNTSQSSSLA